MSHPYSLSMTHPHQAMGFARPIGRRIPSGLAAWNLFIVAVTIICTIGYVIRVNTTTAHSYQLREVEKKVKALQTETISVQDTLAALSSIQEVTTKAKGNGYVPVDKLEFIRIQTKNVALQK